MSNKPVAVLVVVWALGAALPAPAFDASEYLDEEEVTSLLRAPDVGTLDAAYEQIPYPMVPIEVVYRTRRLTLAPGATQEKALLKTLPENPLEFALLMALTDPAFLPAEQDALSDIVRGYFERTARLTNKYPQRIPQFLRLAALTEGETRELVVEWVDWLALQNRSKVASAVRDLHPQIRQALCGDCAGLLGKTR